MRKILILTGSQNYGASTSSATAYTAVTPDILNAGALGIYGLAGTDADTVGNNNKSVLLGDSSATGAAGLTKASVFVTGGGDLIRFVQGAANYPVWIAGIQRRGVTSITKQAFSAPIKQVSFIGYNGTTGSMNLPTVAQNDEGILLALMQEASTSDHIREQENYSTGRLNALADTYTVCAVLANNINVSPYSTITAQVTSDGTQAAFTGTATGVFLTKGSTAGIAVIEGATGFVASTMTGIAAGNIIGIAHANMQIVSFTATLLGTGAGHHIVTIGATQYVVADAGTAIQNATAICTAINAGSQATATNVGGTSAVVTVTVNQSTYAAKILAESSPDDTTWTVCTLTVTQTSGETVGTVAKVAALVSNTGFTLDYAWAGESGYYLTGTSTILNAGVVTPVSYNGLKLTVKQAGIVYNYAGAGSGFGVTGLLSNATFTYTVGSSTGSGSGASVAAIEKRYVVTRGQFDSVDKRMKTLPLFADATQNYDIYIFSYTNSTSASGFLHDKSFSSEFIICIPQSANAVNTGVSVFETLLKTTNLFPNASLNF